MPIGVSPDMAKAMGIEPTQQPVNAMFDKTLESADDKPSETPTKKRRRVLRKKR